MLTFSVSSSGGVWIEQGINSLITLSANNDAGWKKIKRVKVRFELMQRVSDTLEPLIGNINNDPDGRANVIQVANGVCERMVAENKLLAGANFVLDPENPPTGDSAWFCLFGDDIDSLEKIYNTFMFRFAPANN